ncbi:glycogen/starch/alpha-glucan phosphorylase [Oleidesulfovibrio sp.]|uniref:glycogen/starch/alpha-glucan phosphorylase n=1 Tax=Oleidesulfovibrio sp. TaxID=2909707 RepID=UPI003A85454B
MSKAEKQKQFPKDLFRLDSLADDIKRNMVSQLGNDPRNKRKFPYFHALGHSVRERLIDMWMKTQGDYYDSMTKRVYYLSLEFLPGRFLMNYLTNMQIVDECKQVVEELGFSLEELEEEEWDAGLGNGGLGRLASCYLDSMASLRIPGYGYGILYDYGIFYQSIRNGNQEERCDNWRRSGCPWEIVRRSTLFEVRFYGRSEAYHNVDGKVCYRWVDTDNVMAVPCDILIPGYGGEHVSNMRLWAAQSSREFSLADFNRGDYIGAMHGKVMSENITKVLYPNDQFVQGMELRLKQQYFLVSATFQDILRRYLKRHVSLAALPDAVAVQLNDTHPAIAIPELMRLLMDEHNLGWEVAWDICTRTFAYTNHTVLPEALETWPVDLLGRLLPRHMQIIYEINRRFLEGVAQKYPGDTERLSRMSIIQEEGGKRVRMANLAIVGSHTVNGVAALHSHILQTGLFHDFHEYYPRKIRNVTNGITPRRWLLQCNPALSRLITQAVGPDWVCNLDKLRELVPMAEDSAFREAWAKAKLDNKRNLARYVLRKVEMGINPNTMFDMQFKRMHEYKRQLLNVMHVISLFNLIKDNPSAGITPRTVMVGGKAAPGYYQAKLIIRLINEVARVVNSDEDVAGRLRVVFLPNYCISQAEKVIPAADLSEQISTAGMEASGTGNMKFSLNGALTIGTLDGANVEIMEEVGEENIFIFGLKAHEVAEKRRNGYNPREFYENDPELRRVVDMIGSDFFCPDDSGLFRPIFDSLMNHGDFYMLMADYRSYMDAQSAVSALYLDQKEWVRKSILNAANMGKFSSDRSVMEYARGIWNVEPLEG